MTVPRDNACHLSSVTKRIDSAIALLPREVRAGQDLPCQVLVIGLYTAINYGDRYAISL